MTIDWIDIVITILTTGVFSLIGFVWRFSHKVTQMEEKLNELKSKIIDFTKNFDFPIIHHT